MLFEQNVASNVTRNQEPKRAKHYTYIFWPILTFVDMFQCIPIHFDAFWHILMRFDALHILMCFDAFWHVVMHCDAFWCILMYFDAFWCIMKHFDAFWRFLMHFDAFGWGHVLDTLGHFGMCWEVLEHVGSHLSTPAHTLTTLITLTGTHKNLLN